MGDKRTAGRRQDGEGSVTGSKAVVVLAHTTVSNQGALILLLSISKGLAKTEFCASKRWTRKRAWKQLDI